MQSLHLYLTFNGNCREAMQFYKKCLGGKLSLQTIGKTTAAEKLPAQIKKYILQATLVNENMIIMGTDLVSDNGLIKGNAISMMLYCNSEKKILALYKKLSQGGRQTHPLKNNFYGALSGELTDKFGNTWLLSYAEKENK